MTRQYKHGSHFKFRTAGHKTFTMLQKELRNYFILTHLFSDLSEIQSCLTPLITNTLFSVKTYFKDPFLKKVYCHEKLAKS